MKIIAVNFVEAIFNQKSDQGLEVVKVVLEGGTRGKAGVGIGVRFDVELKTMGLISCKKFKPGYAWSIVVGKAPPKMA